MKLRDIWLPELATALISQAGAQQFVHPAKGQSPQGQAAFGKERAACLHGKGDTVQ